AFRLIILRHSRQRLPLMSYETDFSGSMVAHSVMSDSAGRRVMITGLGVICPLGNTPDALWQGLITATSGVGPLTMFPTQGLPLKFAGAARQFATDDIANFGELDKLLQ